VIVCRPADPEAKGLVERAHDYLERSFLPGRSFTGPGDFNGQLQRWLTVVNGRTRRALGCAPATPREEIENEVPAGVRLLPTVGRVPVSTSPPLRGVAGIWQLLDEAGVDQFVRPLP
jgi:hypothetical protein